LPITKSLVLGSTGSQRSTEPCAITRLMQMKDVWKRNLPQITLQAFRTLSLKLHIKFNNWVALLKYRCFSVIIMIPLLLEPIIAQAI